MKHREEDMDLYDISGDYTVISEEHQDGMTITELRTHSGYKVICRIPDHTPEEDQKIASDLCEAMIRIANPGVDLSNTKWMEVIV